MNYSTVAYVDVSVGITAERSHLLEHRLEDVGIESAQTVVLQEDLRSLAVVA